MAPLESSSQKVAGRTLLAGLLLLGAAFVLARVLLAVVAGQVSPRVRKEQSEARIRLAQCLEALPGIAAQPGDKVVVFGSSQVQDGFSPRLFDEAMRGLGREVTSYNLGFAWLNPAVQRVLARRVRQGLEDAGGRATVMLVELAPFQATVVRRGQEQFAAGAERQLVPLADAEVISRRALESPTAAAHLVAYKALGDYTPEAGLAFAEYLIYSRTAPLHRSDPRRRAIGRLFATVARLYGGGTRAWPLETRGEVGLLHPETRADYLEWLQHRQEPSFLRENLEERVATTDILELRFDDRLVGEFIATVRELRRVSDRVAILLMPRHEAWARPTPAGLERLRVTVARIEAETGAELLDLSHPPELEGADFQDVTHLNELTGRAKLARLLALQIAPRLPASGGLVPVPPDAPR